MAWFKKNEKETIWIVREVDISTYGSFTTMNESISTYRNFIDAIGYAELAAKVFEDANDVSREDGKTVRIANDSTCKILIYREFGDYLVIREKRIVVAEFKA